MNDKYKHSYIMGRTGKGIAIHPWDNISKCKCGGQPFMVGKNGVDYNDGYPYKIVCMTCKKTTSYGSIDLVKKEWDDIN